MPAVRLNQSDACLPWMHIVRDILKAARSGAPLPSVPEEHVHTRRVVMHLVRRARADVMD